MSNSFPLCIPGEPICFFPFSGFPKSRMSRSSRHCPIPASALCGAVVAGCVLWAVCVQSTAPSSSFSPGLCLRTPYTEPLTALYPEGHSTLDLPSKFSLWDHMAGWRALVTFSLQFASVHKIYCITTALKTPERHYLFWLLFK